MIQIEQKKWLDASGWTSVSDAQFSTAPQLVFLFGSRALIEKGDRYNEVRGFYPESHILSCSTAGEIIGTEVHDNSISLSALSFAQTTLKFAQADLHSYEESYEVGKRLAQELTAENLIHVLVFSDGLHINGTQLVKGLNDSLPAGIAVTGGLSGDGTEFKMTLLGLDEKGKENNVVAIGFYGTALHVGYGSLGGWDTFGMERTITKSKDNVLYELDGQPALKLYKEYLGDKASGLPGTGLLFPLRLRIQNGGKEVVVVRTILAINEADQSMTFAGDMPEGVPATLMKANFERLIDGASGAGSMSIEALGATGAEFALLVSCVGRKLVLKERIEEETEAVQNAIGSSAAIAGFYSYGELCPVASTENQCELHNQTMTITTFREE